MICNTEVLNPLLKGMYKASSRAMQSGDVYACELMPVPAEGHHYP